MVDDTAPVAAYPTIDVQLNVDDSADLDVTVRPQRHDRQARAHRLGRPATSSNQEQIATLPRSASSRTTRRRGTTPTSRVCSTRRSRPSASIHVGAAPAYNVNGRWLIRREELREMLCRTSNVPTDAVERRMCRHAADQPFLLTIPRKNYRMARPSKGERVSIMAKPAVPLAEVIKHNAAAAGLSYGEYVTAVVAESLGMSEYAPKPARNRANELPIPTEAHTTAA